MSKISDIMDPLGSAQQPSTTDAPTESPLKPGEVGLLDPDGSPIAAPSNLTDTLLSQGYQQDTPENRTQAALRVKYGNAPLAAGLAGAARGATLGLSDQVLTKSGAVSPEALSALEKYNPISSGLGNVAGAVGSAFLGDEAAPVNLVGKVGAGAAEALGGGTTAKLAGSALEGAFYGLGQTATEQALGDPDLTAQKVVANVGLGALLGASGSGVFQGIAGLGRKALGSTGEEALGKFNNYLLGTPEADTAYYLGNQAAVNAAPEVSAIKDVIDDHVSQVQQAFEQSKTAYDNALADVKAMQPNNTMANDLLSAMDEQKSVLGKRGQELEQVLDGSGIMVPKAEVQAAINEQLNKLQIGDSKAVFGAGANAVKGYLEGLSGQLEQLPDALEGSALRQVVRSLRDDGAAAYGLSAGEFSEGKAKAASAIAENLNQHIRKVSEAAAILDDMRSRIQANEGLRQYFGSPDKALASLQSATGDAAKNELRLQALAAFDKATGSNFVDQLRPYQDAKIVTEQMKRGVPASTAIATVGYSSPEMAALGTSAAAHEVNSANWDAVKRLSAGRSQSVIESYMTKTAKAGEKGLPPKFSLEDAKALDHLASLSEPDPRLGGQTIYDAMRARGVLDRFTGSRANGSRNAFILGSLGGGFGGLMGGAPGALVGESAGALAGGMVDRAGGVAAKKIMDAVLMAKKAGNHGVTESLGQFLLKKLGPNVVAGMKASTIAQILDHLQRQNSHDPRHEQRARSLGQLERHSNATTARVHSSVQRFYEGGEVEQRPYEHDVHDTMDDIQNLANNPEALVDRIHSQTAALADMAPQVTQAINDTATRAVQYLGTKVPPPTDQFALDGEPKARPKAQVAAFQTALDTINDPLSVLKHVKDGTLTSTQVEALSHVYPKLYDEIRAHALAELTHHTDKLLFSQKTALSKLVGTPLVRQLSQPTLAANQVSMAATTAQDEAGSASKAARPSQKGLSKLSVADRAQTDFQRSATRQG